jgi:mRNA interferase MazF
VRSSRAWLAGGLVHLPGAGGSTRLMTRGELWAANLGDSVGLRPVVLLSRDGTYQFRNQATVALVTRTIRAIRTQVPVGPDDGIDYDGVINCDDVHTIYLDQLHNVIAPLTRSKLQAVEEALLVAIGIDCTEHV